MAKLKIKFHPLFAIYVFLCVYFGWFNQIFFYVITVTLHEFGHFLFLRHYGYECDSLIFSLNGAGLQSNNNFRVKEEIIIAIAGPLVNLILIVLITAFWWIFPLSYLYTYDFLICNIVVMIFNLTPVYPLDGGRILCAFLRSRGVSNKKIFRLNLIINISFVILFLCLFILSLFFAMNISLIIMSGFFLINIFSLEKNSYYSTINSIIKRSGTPIEIKTFKVDEINKPKLIKYLSPHYYSVFEVGIGQQKVIIEEKDLFE